MMKAILAMFGGAVLVLVSGIRIALWAFIERYDMSVEVTAVCCTALLGGLVLLALGADRFDKV